jgi:hypothetical protein
MYVEFMIMQFIGFPWLEVEFPEMLLARFHWELDPKVNPMTLLALASISR